MVWRLVRRESMSMPDGMKLRAQVQSSLSKYRKQGYILSRSTQLMNRSIHI
jgi:hypothetical protein